MINAVQIPPEIESNIRRQSSLKSSLFSARVEGNTLSLDELTGGSSKDQKKQEVFNILKALNLIQQKSGRDVTAKQILELQKIVMSGLIEKEDLGFFRRDVSAIFSSGGIAIYLPPRPSRILPLMNRLVKFINGAKEVFIPVKASLAHYSFEKIHPFLDGNGRVGRLLIQLVMQRGGYGMKGLLSYEEYIDHHRSEYYRALEDSEKDVTDYLEFMLEAISQTAQKARELVLQKQQAEVEDYLLPRRTEILNIIRDHKLVPFDTIRRRFMAVPDRTLSYDLKWLVDRGLVKKRGSTKGVWYESPKARRD